MESHKSHVPNHQPGENPKEIPMNIGYPWIPCTMHLGAAAQVMHPAGPVALVLGSPKRLKRWTWKIYVIQIDRKMHIYIHIYINKQMWYIYMYKYIYINTLYYIYMLYVYIYIYYKHHGATRRVSRVSPCFWSSYRSLAELPKVI